MRILFVADSPFINGAYPLQLKHLCKRLQADGHECAILGTVYLGKPILVDGVQTFGNYSGTRFAEAIWDELAARWQADFIFTFKDPYIFEQRYTSALTKPWVALAPVDTDPASQVLVSHIRAAAEVITLSQHGQQSLDGAGIAAHYCPLGYVKEEFYPGDKAAAREELGVSPDAFMPLFVGQNNSVPSRKNIDQILLAHAAFRHIAPDTVLYLHTDLQHPEGLDLVMLIGALGIPPDTLRVTDLTQYRSDVLGTDFMRTLYQAADVLLAVSEGEGFCVPAIEAQACGLPVIHTDVTALAETVGTGWKIPITNDGSSGMWVYSKFGGMRFKASLRAIVECLTQARKFRDHPDFRADAISFAEPYEWDHIYKKFWKPTLEGIPEQLESGEL